MPTPADEDALRVEARAPVAVAPHGACPDPTEWPSLGEATSPRATRTAQPSDVASPAPAMTATEPAASSPIDVGTPSDTADPDKSSAIAASPTPSAGDVMEMKTLASTLSKPVSDPAATYLSRDPNAAPSAYPALLPPPPRPIYTSSFLRPGSRFVGKQQSDKQMYKVEVTFKSVDIKESFLCGYLRIEGLTKDHPTLTTYFEGEIIGSRYTFQTKHEAWGATEKTDMQHWNRFPAWRPLAAQAKRADFHYRNFLDKENIFMRWKEYFLVPDHRVREILGASFEGFYYICFNQVKGTVSGIYFHAKSEKFQQLELEHVHDMGGFAAVEFR